MDVEAKLEALGLAVPDLRRNYEASLSGARYVSHLAVGNLLFLSGTVPLKDGAPYMTGTLGADLSVEQGYEAARYAALTSLSALKYALGDLGRVEQIVSVTGYVNSAPGFQDPSRVMNGATDLFVALYGDRGKGTRAAIGCQGLALGSSVEIVPTVLFVGDGVSEPLER